MLGHKPKDVMMQIMKGSHAPAEYIDAVKYFKCDGCMLTDRAPKTHPKRTKIDVKSEDEKRSSSRPSWDDLGSIWGCLGDPLGVKNVLWPQRRSKF